jgi:hypothetical protein
VKGEEHTEPRLVLSKHFLHIVLSSNDLGLSTENFQLNSIMIYDDKKSQVIDYKGDCAVISTPGTFIFLNVTKFSS